MKEKDREPSCCSSPSDQFLRRLMNTSPDLSRGECRITFEVGKGLLIEGFRSVCEYCSESITVSTYCRKVIIEGSGLSICRMLQSTIVICGSISSVSFA